jgi:hypothetical protein
MNRKQRLIAGLSAVTLVAGAAAVVVAVAPANADQGRTGPPPQAQAAVANASAPAAPRVIGRGTTAVAFDPAALTALAPLNPRAIKPSSLSLAADDASVLGSFPIIGNLRGGAIAHSGGLVLTDGSSSLALSAFVIDTRAASPVLTAQVAVNGVNQGRVPFLDVSPVPAAPGCDVSAELTLASTAGFAVADVFGVADLTGAPIGQACVDLR